MNSVTIQSMARINMIPMKGGSPVRYLNKGTNNSPPTPMQNINPVSLAPNLILPLLS